MSKKPDPYWVVKSVAKDAPGRYLRVLCASPPWVWVTNRSDAEQFTSLDEAIRYATPEGRYPSYVVKVVRRTRKKKPVTTKPISRADEAKQLKHSYALETSLFLVEVDEYYHTGDPHGTDELLNHNVYICSTKESAKKLQKKFHSERNHDLLHSSIREVKPNVIDSGCPVEHYQITNVKCTSRDLPANPER